MKTTTQPSSSAFLSRLNQIDFGSLGYKLMHPADGKAWTLEQTTHEIQQYRRFLWLSHRYPQYTIVPSLAVDHIWHQHILDTAKYREDCQTLFGEFKDHWPFFGVGDAADRQFANDAFSETQKLWVKHFGIEM
jgi:hypothetical protein